MVAGVTRVTLIRRSSYLSSTHPKLDVPIKTTTYSYAGSSGIIITPLYVSTVLRTWLLVPRRRAVFPQSGRPRRRAFRPLRFYLWCVLPSRNRSRVATN
jgi:hypothetical protein